MWPTEAYSTALAIQRLIAKCALDDKLDRKLLPGYARAFCELEELKLRLRMKPAPKPIDVAISPPMKRLAAGSRQFLDVLPVQQPPKAG